MLFPLVLLCAAATGAGSGGDGDGLPVKRAEPAIAAPAPASTVEWDGLARSSLRLLTVMHGFRLLTEPGTRAGGLGLGTGYIGSVTNLHGWADGDPFYVNYVGHPMQGAVAGRLWLRHDPRYRRTEFGGGAAYWKGNLRAAAFAWVFSEQFEIGPLSEASIGHIQRDFPQQGFVDQVTTPTAGLGWMIAEDVLDRYLVKGIEARTTNPLLRIAARTAINPARSFANLMDWRVPWYRASRPGVYAYEAPREVARTAAGASSGEVKSIAPLEVTAGSEVRRFGGNLCVGGGAEGAWRLVPELQMVLRVDGCKMIGQKRNTSGDALVYQAGPRWTPDPAGRWSPFAHLLIGGLKVTREVMDPAEKQRVLVANATLDPSLAYTLHGLYTRQQESSALALTAGMGVDYRLNSALAIRVASLEYLRSSASTVPGSGFQMSSGMVLRWGTW